MRLVGGPNEFEGRVEVCLGGEWRRWCAGSTFVQNIEASVVCRQLHGKLSEGSLDTQAIVAADYQIDS